MSEHRLATISSPATEHSEWSYYEVIQKGRTGTYWLLREKTWEMVCILVKPELENGLKFKKLVDAKSGLSIDKDIMLKFIPINVNIKYTFLS